MTAEDRTDRATGRRIGRIVGQLDDILTLVRTYSENEYGVDGDTHDLLYYLYQHVEVALNEAEGVAAHINKRDGRGK